MNPPAPAKPQTDVSRVTPAAGSARDALRSTAVLERFEQVLGDKTKASLFVASLSTLVYANQALSKCDRDSIIAAAIQAAALDLPINPNLGFAYIVPYKGKAQFQPGYKGIIQLALRTGQYARLEVNHAFEGEVTVVNRFTGEMKIAPATSEKVAGVLAYLRLLSGFEKMTYWTIEQIHKHAKRYSPGYDRREGAWQTNPDAMELKTVLGALVRKWGIMSVELVKALATDDEIEPETSPLTPEQAARDRAALFGADEATGEVVEGTPPTPEQNAAMDRAIAESEKA